MKVFNEMINIQALGTSTFGGGFLLIIILNRRREEISKSNIKKRLQQKHESK